MAATAAQAKAKALWNRELENLTEAALKWGAHVTGERPDLDTLRLRAEVLEAMRRYHVATMAKRAADASSWAAGDAAEVRA